MASTATNTAVIPFFDPHFHIWDVANLHSVETLGAPAQQFPTYSLADYEAHITVGEAAWGQGRSDGESAAAHPCHLLLRHVGGVVVEALPNEERGADEVEWIHQAVQEAQQQQKDYALHSNSTITSRRSYSFSARLHLLNPKRDEELARLAALNVTAVRHIVNFEPSWPFVTSNLLLNDDWAASLRDLPSKGVRLFELHCNTHQLLQAAQIVKGSPAGLTFVLNHMGNRRNGVDSYDDWRRGVAALAASENCLVKLSDPNYVDPVSWNRNDSVTAMVHDLLLLFGTNRCMVATNYPVAITCGAPPERLFSWFRKVFSHLSVDDLENIFFRTAVKAYTGSATLSH